MSMNKTLGQIVEVVHEPGNGTRYHIIVCQYKKGQWAVALPDFKGCLMVSEGNSIHYGYVMEKVARVSDSPVDASEIAKAVALAVPKCSALGCTNIHGRMLRSEP